VPVLVLLAVVALGWNLSGYRLLDPDEGRNAEVAREMAHSHDYLVPHLDGLPYLDKPIVYFAAAAGLMELLGPTELAARLPAYLATLATIALLAWFARRRWGEGEGGEGGQDDAAWLAALSYATMVLPLVYARTAIFDSTLTLFTTAAILCFFEERTIWAWAAIGVGALTKGPIAVAIPLLVAVPHAVATGAPVRALFPWRGLAAFAAVTLPWFLAVTIRHPELPSYVFVRETFERLTTRSFHRTAPFWYFLPIVPLAAFPWFVPALAGVARGRETWRARREPAAREPLLLACWVLVPLVFFTLSRSKLPQYVLPLMPAFALAATRSLVTRGIGAAARAYGAVALVAGVGLVALTRWLPAPLSLTPAEKAAIPPTAVALGITVLVSGLLVTAGALRQRPRVALLGYAMVVIAIPFASGKLLQAVGEDRSSAPIAVATAAALERAGATGAVLGIAAYPPSLPFYLGRPVAVATATAHELTSNYIADYEARYRDISSSPLLPAGYWREVLARCPVPTVFLTTAGDRDARAVLGAALPLLAADGHYAAYGPCRPHPLTPSPQRGERERQDAKHSPSPQRGEGAGG